MGSYNNCCVLTRTPIAYGDEAVIFTCFPTLDGQAPHNLHKTATLLGLPFVGEYDDYGVFTEYANQALVDLTNQVINDNPFYRRVTFTKSYGGSSSVLLANSVEAYFSAESKISSFYATPEDPKASFDDRNKAISARYEAAKKSLTTLVAELQNIQSGMSEERFDAAVSAAYDTAFGANADLARSHLANITQTYSDIICMHKVAYDVIVKEWGSRVQNRKGVKQTVRALVTAEFEELKSKHLSPSKSYTLYYNDFIESGISPEKAKFAAKAMTRGSDTNFDFIKPISSPWLVSNIPLSSHFWDAVDVADVLAIVPESDIIDYFVFSWARNYIAMDFVPNPGLGQCEEVKLLDVANKAVFRMLREQGRIKRDL